MSRPSRLPVLVAILALLAACTAGTSPSPSADASEPPASTASSAPPSEATADCTPETLDTKTAGRLTIGTDNPAFPPYWNPPAEGESGTEGWELGDPYNKGGFEGAVAWALAEELGFAEDDVDFIPVPFDLSYAPGEKDFDVYLAQVSFTPERAENATLSDGYFFSNQALVANADTAITEATSIADLAAFRLGAQVGTTSLAYIDEQIQPDAEPMVYNDNTAAIAALDAGQIDGILVDLATAFFVTAVQMDNGVIVGQFPAAGEEQEHFSLVLEQGSTLIDCVNAAIASLQESGDLEAITDEWMSENAGVPVFE